MSRSTMSRSYWTKLIHVGHSGALRDPIFRENEKLTHSNIYTVKLSGTELRTLPPLVLGGIIENQNSDFVMT